MFKKSIALFILVFLLMLTAFYLRINSILNSEPVLNSQKTTNSIDGTNIREQKRISFNRREYSYLFFKVSNPEKLFLISNFKEKKSTQKIKEEELCSKGVNGGFYDETNNPLGGFITEGKTYKDPIESSLLDGFLWIKGNDFGISTINNPQARINIQSGPILISDGKLRNLSISNDEYSRRSLAFITDNGELMFMIIFDPEDQVVGPALEELPNILYEIAKKENFTISNAINLDGGNASAFYVNDSFLIETTRVGSFFCLKE